VTGRNPKLDIAIALEKIALEDEYFVKRKLYPNVDFYSGSFTRPWDSSPRSSPCCSPSAVTRLAGAVAGVTRRPAQKIARPRQVFLGSARREFVPLDQRGAAGAAAV